MPHPIDLFIYWIQWGSFWRKWSFKDYSVTWSARTVTRKTSSAFGKAGPQLTPFRQWWTSPLKQEEKLVSVRDSARWSALTYAMRSISEVEHPHQGEGAEKGSRLPVANDWWLSERQVGDIRGRQVVSQRRDDMWCPSRVTWVHSFGTSCMTISCAWTYLLERASLASRMTHLSCALLTTSEFWSWGSMKVFGGQSVGWIADA